jgi:hypothetical protein
VAENQDGLDHTIAHPSTQYKKEPSDDVEGSFLYSQALVFLYR